MDGMARRSLSREARSTEALGVPAPTGDIRLPACSLPPTTPDPNEGEGMLRNTRDLKGYAVGATDGAIGHVDDFYFDDEAWVVRYLVVDTGGWLSGRKVLISPMAIGKPNWTDKVLPVSVTKEQVRNSPDIDTEKPVSRQQEIQYSGYYGYPYYWGGAGYWGGGMYPNVMLPGYSGFGSEKAERLEAEDTAWRAEEARKRKEDPHLRSCNAVMRYHLHATDGDIGHVQSLLVDDETWAVRYLVVDTSNWWLGQQVLIAPEWITEVSWAERTVSIQLTRQAVKEAPRYDPKTDLNRSEEARLHDHYGRRGYWEQADTARR